MKKLTLTKQDFIKENKSNYFDDNTLSKLHDYYFLWYSNPLIHRIMYISMARLGKIKK